MDNITTNTIKLNLNETQVINNYNNNIINNSSKKYSINLDSLYQKLKSQKNKDENDLNEYYCNFLMLYYKKIATLGKINLLKFLYVFNSNPKDDNYKYYIFKKLSKLIGNLKEQDEIEINISKIIDIFIEQGKFFYEKGNTFYAYNCLYNGLYRDNINIKKLRHKIKGVMFEDNNALKEYFLKLNQNDYKSILSRLKEISKNDLNQESKEMFYVVNKFWLDNAIKFIKNILNFKLIEFEERLNKEFELNEIYQNYFFFPNNYEILYPYPGQIDNYSISDFYDLWKDPINEDENYFLKKISSFPKDYSLADENNWNFINELFGSTNIIKRKINNLQLIKFKVVILDKRFIKQHKNLLKPKYIQTALNINIKEFKEKILRCVNNELKDYEKNNNTDENRINEQKSSDYNYTSKNIYNKYDINEININFFKLKKGNKTLLIELFTAYINQIFPYESVYVEKINLNDENNLKDILNIYNSSSDILIIELTENNTEQFLYQIEYDTNGQYQCPTCNTKIFFQEKYICDRCYFSIYCSKKCSQVSSPLNSLHDKLHEYLKEYQVKSDNDLSLDTHINMVGLMNLGNTCFINSSIQCLFHTKELSNYFLYDMYTKEINKENTQGSKGLIAESFADLIKEIYTTSLPKINPINFLKVFFKINKTLYAGNQHDAQEFLSILLDNLHEDLNRINKKPYIVLDEQKEHETDKEASERFWKLYKKRDNSIIVDLFHGQFKSKISCMGCGNECINYDPYIFLGLPIPEKKERIIIKFVFMNKLEYFGFDLNENTIVLELKQKAVEHMKMCGYKKEEKNEVLYDTIEIVLMDQNKIIRHIYNDTNKLNDKEFVYNILKMNNSLELVLYEKKLDNNYFNIYIYPIKQYDYDTSSYPISLSVTGDMTFNDIIKENKQKIINMYVNVGENENILIGILHKKNSSWTYYLTNMFDSEEYCPVCNNKNSNFCLINDNIKIQLIKNKLKNHEPILFVMGTSNKAILNKNMKMSEDLHNGLYFLNDCLKSFCEAELLMKENKWYCNKCKAHQNAKKQIKLYKMPKYLIIHLKKFENRVNFFNFQNEKKKEDFIKYPINNLDLSDFIDNEEEKKYRYDLYAVIQHHGTINEGHYTAICNINDNWVLYNDSKIYKTSNPVTNDAYILFYKRNE